MNRVQLEQAIRIACVTLRESHVVIFGSQSILGSYDDDQLPDAVTMSREVDMYPYSGLAGADRAAVESKLSILDVFVGEDSEFHGLHGIYVEGVHRETLILPACWDLRLVPVHVTAYTPGDGFFTRHGLCLHPLDLCVAKGLAGRPKDHAFIAALLSSALLTSAEVVAHLDEYDIEWPSTYPHADQNALAESRFRNWLATQ
ncbi:hypothetical protein [Nocardia sp. NPDC004260]